MRRVQEVSLGAGLPILDNETTVISTPGRSRGQGARERNRRQLVVLTRKKVHCFPHRRERHGHERGAVFSQVAHLHVDSCVVGPRYRSGKDAFRAQAEYAPESQSTQEWEVACDRVAASEDALRHL